MCLNSSKIAIVQNFIKYVFLIDAICVIANPRSFRRAELQIKTIFAENTQGLLECKQNQTQFVLTS